MLRSCLHIDAADFPENIPADIESLVVSKSADELDKVTRELLAGFVVVQYEKTGTNPGPEFAKRLAGTGPTDYVIKGRKLTWKQAVYEVDNWAPRKPEPD